MLTDLKIHALTICCVCSDGVTRPVRFEGKQAKQIKGYLTHIQGGTLKLYDRPVDVIECAEDVAATPEVTA